MIKNKIKENYPLAQLSTFKIGGNAQYFVELETRDEVEAAWAWAREHRLPVTVLGGGSNILINDEGVKGLVVKVHNSKLEFADEKIICGASVQVWDLAEAALEKSLSGIEWSIGIPGSMGGAIRGNAGAHGGSFDKVVESVVVYDSEKNCWVDYHKDDCDFRYRSSRFKTEPHFIVWDVLLRLKASEDKIAMEKIMAEYKNYRVTSQPKEPSAGCIFKNLFAADVEKINPELFKRAQTDGKIRGGKIGAGYLIEQLGLKGEELGGAKISEKHANFIVNANNAKAIDVHSLSQKTKQSVREAFKIDLEEEIQFIGF